MEKEDLIDYLTRYLQNNAVFAKSMEFFYNF